MKTFLASLATASVLALAGCQTTADLDAPETIVVQPALAAAVNAQPEETQARYGARHPAQTLAFFGIEPGMEVVEALPGGGWYSKILIPYIGTEGRLIGAHYPDDMWIRIIPGADQERVDGLIDRMNGWVADARTWYGDEGADVQQYKLTTMDEPDNHGTVDAVLFIRALHNLHRVEGDLGYYTATLAETYDLLKPGGIVGVVQHRAPETNSDEWADGNAGYLKQSYVISTFEAAGFVLEATSEINANAADMPTEEDIVWRLPPSRATTDEGSPERAVVDAIGESDRMTLRFRKPA